MMDISVLGFAEISMDILIKILVNKKFKIYKIEKIF